MSRNAADAVYWIVLAFWIITFVRYSMEYARMIKACNALTRSLLPLEARISQLETLAIQNEDPDYLNEVQGFEF